MSNEILSGTKVLEAEGLNLPSEYPFPYQPESFSEEEKTVLSRFFTNHDQPVYAIKGLPQEVAGALFSRYSRTPKSVRRVFLDEFWGNPDLGIQNISEYLVEEGEDDLASARERAARFYKSVFVEYGDDSVIQMGSVHISAEFVSQIAAKAIEDRRIGAAYIEKSTRYVDFGSEVDGHCLFMEEPTIMESEHAAEYLEWNESLFAAYEKHMGTTREMLSRLYRIEEQVFRNPKTGEEAVFSDLDEDEKGKAERAYNRALKAKTFDTIRVFLPTTTVTNLGAHFSGQTAELAINKMLSSPYPEVRLIGAQAFKELMKVTPNFLQNVDRNYGQTTRGYLRDVLTVQEEAVAGWIDGIEGVPRRNEVRLVDFCKDADVIIATQLIYTGQRNRGKSKREIVEWAKKVKEEDLSENIEFNYSPRLAEIILSAVPDRSGNGLNRRHKLPRAFEHASAEVEFDVDFGIFRDLQRNRMSSTERQMLSAEKVHVPPEFYEEGMEEVLKDYLAHAERTRELNGELTDGGDPELLRAAEYVTMFGNKLRFNVRANLRQWAFFAELRTISGGHPSYRRALQKATKQILTVYPFMEPLFTHVDWERDYGLGRLSAEIKTQEKLSEVAGTRN